MPENLEKSALATGLGKISFHSSSTFLSKLLLQPLGFLGVSVSDLSSGVESWDAWGEVVLKCFSFACFEGWAVGFGSRYRHWPKVASFPTLNRFFFFFLIGSLGQTSSFIDLSRGSLWVFFPVCWPHYGLALTSWVTLGNLFNLS